MENDNSKDIEIVDDNLRTLAKRGDDENIPFEGKWVSCHRQNCRSEIGNRNRQQFIRCRPVKGGCEVIEEETTEDVYCCCELFRYNPQVPKNDRVWEHVPGGKKFKPKEDEWKYQCFCVVTIPWNDELMNCR